MLASAESHGVRDRAASAQMGVRHRSHHRDVMAVIVEMLGTCAPCLPPAIFA